MATVFFDGVNKIPVLYASDHDLRQCIIDRDLQALQRNIQQVSPQFVIQIVEADWQEGVELLNEKLPEMHQQKLRYFKAAISELSLKAMQHFAPEKFNANDEYINDAIEALDQAVSSDKILQIVEWLIDKGHPVSKQLLYSFAYIAYSDFAVLLPLASLLVKYGADPNMLDEENLTPLMSLLKGYDYRRSSRIPKYYGAQAPINLGAVNALLAVGADVKQKDDEGNTVMHYFAFISDQVESDIPAFTKKLKGRDESTLSQLCQTLLSCGADLNVKNSGGWAPLVSAVNPDCILSKVIMIQNGADLNVTDPEKSTIGHMLFDNPPSEDLVRKMLAVLKEEKFNFESKDAQGISVSDEINTWEKLHPHPIKRLKSEELNH